MKKIKRLFLFAGYDKDNIVDDTVIYYLNALSRLGDVVFFADTDLPANELQKISQIKNVLYAGATRHREYDFGSYKRAYLWATEHLDLSKYDWVYLVNDSVYGPLNDLQPVVTRLENSGADLIGMAANRDEYTPLHVQSWFVGFNRAIFGSEFFDKFMRGIKHIPNKMHLVLKYEVGLTAMIMRHGFKMQVVLDANNNNLYSNPRHSLIMGVPFIKKTAAPLICDFGFLAPHMDDDILLDKIQAHMQRHGMVLARDNYRTIYELRLFGLRLIRVLSKDSRYYKVYVFGKIPVLKIIKE